MKNMFVNNTQSFAIWLSYIASKSVVEHGVQAPKSHKESADVDNVTLRPGRLEPLQHGDFV